MIDSTPSVHLSETSMREALAENDCGVVSAGGVQAGLCSEKGDYRKANEDSCVADVVGGVFVAADGVGGQRGGKEASTLVAKVIPIWLAETLKCGWRDIDILETALSGALDFIRNDLKILALENPLLKRAAATAAFALVDETHMYVARIGDCRAYLFRNGEISQLTKDESFCEMAVEADLITVEQVETHPWRNHVMNVISSCPLSEPLELLEFSLQPGDRVVLSTDGLHDHLRDHEFAQLLFEAPNAQTAADALVNKAFANNSRDNASCVVIDIL